MPRYQELWGLMRQATARSDGFHASYLDAHILVGIVPEVERELFAANMYSYGLLAQVFHSYVRPSDFIYPKTKDAENTFPKVCGVLSTIDRHICSVVLPSMLLYWTPDLLNQGCSFRDRDREQKLWLEREDIFDAGHRVITGKIDDPTRLLTGREDWDWELLFLRYFTEHGHLKSKVQERNDTDRVVNQQP